MLAWTALASCGRDGGTEPVARHVILISLDTVRADHLGCYGRGSARTPRIDALAAAGVRFDAAVTPAPTTLAAHASILTGTYPHTHGVPRNGFVLDEANQTLAEALQDAGFTTLAAVGAYPVAGDFGLALGFDRYDDDLPARTQARGYAERPARDVTDSALRMTAGLLGEDAGARTFLFVHYFDAHAPYTPEARFRRSTGWMPPTLEAGVIRAADDHYRRLTGAEPGRSVFLSGLPSDLVDAAGGEPLPIDRMLDALYDDEIAGLDHEVGRLLDGLAKLGLLDDALVVLTADHGETMWEHADFWNHGLGLFETTVRVPLIVRLPEARANPAGDGRARAVEGGGVVGMPVSSIDIAPTILALAGAEQPARFEGVDLGPLLAGEELLRGPVFAEATMPFGVESEGFWRNSQKPRAVRDGRWKYILWPYNGHEQLFDVVDDPGESRNLLTEPVEPEARARAAELARQLELWHRAAKPLASEARAGRDPAARQRLETLGYGDRPR